MVADQTGVDSLDGGRRLGGVLVAEWSKAELSGNAESSLVSGTVPATGLYGQCRPFKSGLAQCL